METLGFVPGENHFMATLNSSILSHLPHFKLPLNQSSLRFPHHGDFSPQLLPIKTALVDLISSLTYPQLAAILLVSVWLLLSLFQSHPKVSNAVYHGYRSWLEPSFLVKARYIISARDIITSGYQKYQDKTFVVRRWDTDISVLPGKYLNELRLYPNTKLSAVKAQVANIGHKWTYTTLMQESNLHFRVLQNKLTVDLPRYLDIAKTELDYGWEQHMPQSDDWIEVDIQSVVRMLVARMSAKIFLGYPACRNEEWLKLSIEFSIDLFATAFSLRMFPPWTHPVIGRLHPGRFRIKRNLKTAQRIVGPLIEKHQEDLRKRAAGEEVEADDTLLNWMIDNGNEKENKLEEMANRQAILTLASIHTTAMGVANLLFDLCAHPEWFPVLREEIETIERDLGKLGSNEGIGAKQWLPRLEKLDSFFLESQRLNPPILLAPQRLAVIPITLKDGTHIPAGARIAFANADICNSSEPESEKFDPMRSYRKRYETGELNKYRAGQTDQNYLHFGYGTQACPGRHFAIGELKMVMTKVLMDLEFKYPAGKGRPKNFYADENVFPDPRAKLMMRKRRTPCDKCGRTE